MILISFNTSILIVEKHHSHAWQCIEKGLIFKDKLIKMINEMLFNL